MCSVKIIVIKTPIFFIGYKIPCYEWTLNFNSTELTNTFFLFRFQYLSGIGYCPQFNGINEHLTAQEMLDCFAALRGIPASKSNDIINYWIELLGKLLRSGIFVINPITQFLFNPFFGCITNERK